MSNKLPPSSVSEGLLDRLREAIQEEAAKFLENLNGFKWHIQTVREIRLTLEFAERVASLAVQDERERMIQAFKAQGWVVRQRLRDLGEDAQRGHVPNLAERIWDIADDLSRPPLPGPPDSPEEQR